MNMHCDHGLGVPGFLQGFNPTRQLTHNWSFWMRLLPGIDIHNRKLTNSINTCIETSTKILAVAKTNIELQNCGLVVFYDIQQRNKVGLFL